MFVTRRVWRELQDEQLTSGRKIREYVTCISDNTKLGARVSESMAPLRTSVAGLLVSTRWLHKRSIKTFFEPS